MEKRDAGQHPRKGRRQPSPTRRWDIDHAILEALGSGSRTLSQLYRIMNPGVPRTILRGGGSGRPWALRPRVDKRKIKRHLRYLQRDGHVQTHPQVKVLRRDIGAVAWRINYYQRIPAGDHPTPGGTPLTGLQPAAEIHNPFHGPEGAIRFIRWLRDPQ